MGHFRPSLPSLHKLGARPLKDGSLVSLHLALAHSINWGPVKLGALDCSAVLNPAMSPFRQRPRQGAFV